jgi:hypothetical protein
MWVCNSLMRGKSAACSAFTNWTTSVTASSSSAACGEKSTSAICGATSAKPLGEFLDGLRYLVEPVRERLEILALDRRHESADEQAPPVPR